MDHPPKYKLQLLFDSAHSIQIGIDTEPKEVAKFIMETMELHSKRDPKLPRLFTKFLGWDNTMHYVDLHDLKYWSMEVIEVQPKSNLTIPTLIAPNLSKH